MTSAPTMRSMWVCTNVSLSWLVTLRYATGNFDESTHKELGRPEKFCGAQQARPVPDAELNSLTWSEWGMSLVEVFFEAVGTV